MTTLETKTNILHQFWVEYSQDAGSEEASFINDHDIGVPLASLLVLGNALATPKGVKWIEEDFDSLCELMGIDKYGDYDSLETMLEISEYPDAEG
jgi:hypothetical protein